MNPVKRFFKALLQAMSHPRRWLTFNLQGTKFDYAREVGDAQEASVVMAPVFWIARNSIQAQPEVLRIDREEPERVAGHDMLKLLERPNPFYNGKMLQMATLISLCTAGYSYLIKVRNGQGKLAELWYVPHYMMTPEVLPGNEMTSYIDFYRYTPGGEEIKLDPFEVVHFRHGINPRDTRQGISPIYPALREIYADVESANFTGALLHNFGFPGVVISPDNWDSQATSQDAKDVKEKFQETFSGDRRGEPLVMTGPTKVSTFGYSPDEMSLDKIRNISEERVCALLGVQPSVVGFGTGLQQTKVGATMVENRRSSWEDGVLPFLDILASTFTESVLPEFETNPDPFIFHYNVSTIRALQESQDALWKRVTLGVRGGWLRVDIGQTMVGLEPDPSQAVYLRGANVFETPAKAAPEHWARGMKSPLLQIHANGYAQLPAALVKGRPPRNAARLMAQLARDQTGLEKQLYTDLLKVLGDYGRTLEQSTLDILAAGRADPQASLLILENVNILEVETQMGETLGAHYGRTAEKTVRSINSIMNMSVRIPDPVAREIVATGGRRAGLIDLRDKIRRRLFAELAEGQRLGLGAPQIARNVRDFVPAGPWSTSDIRARVIARTETMHAQRVSALHTFREMDPAANVMVFDARLGATDDECEALNGQVVTQEEAWALADSEHPNGTRSFAILLE